MLTCLSAYTADALSDSEDIKYFENGITVLRAIRFHRAQSCWLQSRLKPILEAATKSVRAASMKFRYLIDKYDAQHLRVMWDL